MYQPSRDYIAMENPTNTTFTRLAWLTDANGAFRIDHDHLTAHLDAVRDKEVCHVCGHAETQNLRSYIAGLRMCADVAACQARYAALPEPIYSNVRAEPRAA